MKREVVRGHVPTHSGPRRSKRIATREERQLVVPRPYIGAVYKAPDSKGPRPPISKRVKPTSRKKPPSSKKSKPPNSVGELTKACIRLNIKPESSPAKVKTEKVYLDFNANYFGDNYNPTNEQQKDQGFFLREATEEVVELRPPQMDVLARELKGTLDEYYYKWKKILANKTNNMNIQFIDFPWPIYGKPDSNQYLLREEVARFFLAKDRPDVEGRSQPQILEEEKRRWSIEHIENLEKLGVIRCNYIKSGIVVVRCVLRCIGRLQRSSHKDESCMFCVKNLIVKEKKK